MPLPPALRSRLTPTDLQIGCRRRCTAPFRQLCVFVVHTETMTVPCTLHSTAPPVAAALHCHILAAIFLCFVCQCSSRDGQICLLLGAFWLCTLRFMCLKNRANSRSPSA